MKIDWLIQKDGENTIGKKIEDEFNKKPSNVYMFLGSLKDSGLEILEEGLIGTKAKVQVIFGYDKKNTTKLMLETILKHTKEVYGYNNNEVITLDGNIIVFKYKECASLFMYSGNTSESGLKDNISMYTHIIYDFALEQDKEEYKKFETKFKMLIKEDNIVNLINKTKISELSSNKEIFTQKIYNHSVKSVAELISESKEKKSDKVNKKEEAKLEDIKFDDLDSSIDFDIDFSSDTLDFDVSSIEDNQTDLMEDIEIPEEEYASEVYEEEEYVYENNDELEENIEIPDEALDLESMIFSSPSVKMGKNEVNKIKNEKEENKEEDIEKYEEEIRVVSKKLNLKNVSTLVMQLPRQLKKGKEKDLIKVPNYVSDLIPNFIDMSDSKVHKDNNEVVKEKNISIDILNIEENIKYEDKNAKIIHKAGQTYIGFESEIISNIEIEENSIARIFKIDNNSYSIEIIPVESSEYSIWKKICNLSLRGSNRKYGVM